MINKIYTALIIIMSGLLSYATVKISSMQKELIQTNINNQILKQSLNKVKKRNALLQANEDKRKKIRERIKEEVNYSNLNLEDVVDILEVVYEK